ncbi:MAG: zf-HC2 domain-containing protein [Anaerotignum sp.]
MSWKCDIVTDLAPLYHDREASKASRRLVREHLRECPECRANYRKYRPVRDLASDMPFPGSVENFAVLAKKMRTRRLLLGLGFLSYVGATMGALVLQYLQKNR